MKVLVLSLYFVLNQIPVGFIKIKTYAQLLTKLHDHKTLLDFLLDEYVKTNNVATSTAIADT